MRPATLTMLGRTRSAWTRLLHRLLHGQDITVDVHTHVIPDALLAMARSSDGLFGVREEDGFMVHPQGFRAPLSRDFHDPEAILARMDQTGIDVSVLSTSPTLLFYDEDAKPAETFARRANDALADLISRSDRLYGLAHLPLQAPERAADELQRAVTVLGLRGAQIGTNVEELPLEHARLDPVFDAAQDLDVPLLLHPYFVGPKPRLEPYFLTNTIGNPLDSAIAAARLIHSGVLDRWPRLRFVLVHGGGYLPYQLGRLDHAYAVRPEAREHISQPPSAYLNQFWFDTLTHSDDALRFLKTLVGTKQLLPGTDCPYDMADTHLMDRLARTGVDPGVLSRNARALFLDHAPHRPRTE
ncbi:amidohydrolase family protein [Streptomyces sp. 7N604]|uniref:amidohydrolase family protein n=1 Tax=Streptomyces sp. 7N604 TaxID=3457415 RepID=UPI003FD2A753